MKSRCGIRSPAREVGHQTGNPAANHLQSKASRPRAGNDLRDGAAAEQSRASINCSFAQALTTDILGSASMDAPISRPSDQIARALGEPPALSNTDDSELKAPEWISEALPLALPAKRTFGLWSVPSVSPAPKNTVQRRPITVAERNAAIAHATANYDVMSIRIIQNIVGTGVDGSFGRLTAEAVSNFQTANGILPDDGRVQQNSLDRFITNRVSANRRNEAIHLVTDFFNLDITTDTLSVYSEPGASRPNPAPPPATFPADTDFESGGLRVIRVGTAAFTNAATLRNTIRRELNRVAPIAAGPAAPVPALLNRAQVRRAIAYMRSHYRDRRSIVAMQGLFAGVNPTGIVDEELVQRIAGIQDTTAALVQVDGMVGRNTLEHLFTQLRDGGDHNAAMRLVMDFYDMPHYHNLLTIYYQDTGGYTGYAGTSRNRRGPVRIRVRRALYMPFAAMVHTLRHELEHVGQHRRGIASAHTREALAECTEIISRGMDHETLFDVSTPDASGTGLVNVSGFQNDVNRMVTRWNQMPAADQRTHWSTFVRARRIIRRRIARTYGPTRAADQAEWAAATPAQRAALIALLATVNAVATP